ncbi:MAG: hypothetical protein J6T10_20915 [Methanobrevibacter sp.]|nr:hypothetical protein [Methanobrevibacter sp.]
MNVYKDFVAVHNMKADPRDIKIFVDWLLASDPDTQAYKIGEAMQTAIDNYIEDNENHYLKEMI